MLTVELLHGQDVYDIAYVNKLVEDNDFLQRDKEQLKKAFDLLEHSEQTLKQKNERLKKGIKSAMLVLECGFDIEGNSLKESDAWDYLAEAIAPILKLEDK